MLQEALTNVKTVAISGHVRPDGDCVGSCMGLYQYIQQNYHEIDADVYLEEFPDTFAFIAATKDIKHEAPADKKYDLFIVLDCGALDRLGFSGILYEKAEKTLCIDHHISNQAFADMNYIVPEASSTCELVYRLLEREKIDRNVAMSLYLGIVHDTGVFQYSSTSPETMEIAADLMRKDFPASDIIEATYYEKSYSQIKIFGQAIANSYLLLEGKCIVSVLTKTEMEQFGVKAKHLDGIVSQLREVKGVETAVFIYELDEGDYKVSLRSKNLVDVSRIAMQFGGGGHRKAAGLSLEGPVEKIVTELSEAVAEQLE